MLLNIIFSKFHQYWSLLAKFTSFLSLLKNLKNQIYDVFAPERRYKYNESQHLRFFFYICHIFYKQRSHVHQKCLHIRIFTPENQLQAKLFVHAGSSKNCMHFLLVKIPPNSFLSSRNFVVCILRTVWSQIRPDRMGLI